LIDDLSGVFRFCLWVHDFIRVQVHALLVLWIYLVSRGAVQEDATLGTCLLKRIILLVFEFTKATEPEAVSLTGILAVKVDGRGVVDYVLVLLVRAGLVDGLAIL